MRHDALRQGCHLAVTMADSAGQDGRWSVGVVFDHAVAGIERLIQAHGLHQAARYFDAEPFELFGHGRDIRPVAPAIIEAGIDDLIVGSGRADGLDEHLQEQLTHRPVVACHDEDVALATACLHVMPAHATAPGSLNTARPSMTAEWASNLSQTTPACSANSKMAARSTSVGMS